MAGRFWMFVNQMVGRVIQGATGERRSRKTDGGIIQAERRENMKATLNILGAVLVLIGAIWFLQGINVLPGSFMTGQIRWAVYGGIAVVAGSVLLMVANRRRKGGG